MFDHIGVRVQDLEASVAFYRQALAPLGYGLESSGEGYAGFGPPGAPAFWLHAHPGGAATGAHIALRARDRVAVERFHEAGTKAAGRDNGAPGLRADFGANYFAAFLIDPDGNNVEAVCNPG